ncbi:hypothetical protein NC77_14335 [Janthinobacterium lividum]|uniref:hypothetical protein n=1 Tax=Janthinobacterium lividum TaxID=29581 RepID=UPI0005378B6A|nr:hypothetical protein [Janthinobacterium lividum]KHA78007.1 hypothetical protein NC77_14335 [Janthinobacterium lividum]
MNDDTDAATRDDEPWPAWCHPPRAKDMLGVTAHIVRDMLVSGAHEELYEIYGIRPKEAKQSLHYVELAELRAWGLDEMIEATLPGQSSSEERLRRRIVLATKAEGVPESLHPGDAVLLLERSGLMLVDELRDAIVYMSTRTYGDNQSDFSLLEENRLRRLLGRPILTEEEYGSSLGDDGQRSELPKILATAPALKRTIHVITKRVRVLAAEIEQAIQMAGSDENRPVWAELSKLADAKYGAIIGYATEGIQYRGDTHRLTGEPDILTFKQLCDRLRNRRNKRAKAG